MKKILFVILIIAVVPMILFVGCDNQGNGEEQVFYFDQTNIDIEGIHLDINCSEYTMQNTNLVVTFTATNTQLQDKNFYFEDLKVVNELTKVEYKCTSNIMGSVTLQYNIKTTLQITSTIPNSYKDDNYYIKFKMLGKACIINLYETPDELRTSHIVSFKIFTYPSYVRINDQVEVKNNRNIQAYTWEDSSHLYYCNTWYTDEERTQEFSWSTKIVDNITLYGFKKSNIQTYTDSSGTFVNGINYVPRDGILIITGFSDKIYISNYGLKNNGVKEIYFPKELKKIYLGNFTGMSSLTKIHFAGDESEWDNVENMSEIPDNVSIIFNSTYAA